MNNFINTKLFIATQIASAVLSIGSVATVSKVVQHTPNVCLTQSCEVRVRTTVQETDTEDNAIAPAKTITATTRVTTSPAMDSADVRAMILNEYDQYVSGMKTYMSSTYPTWSTVSEEFHSKLSAVGNNPSYYLTTSNETGYGVLSTQINTDISAKISKKITDFCDLNHSITKEADRAYCHTVFVQNSIYQKLI